MKYLVIGLGNTGLSLLSMLKNSGFDVQGYNRPGESLEKLKSIKECKVEGLANFSFKVDFINEDLRAALIRSDLVFVCVPAHDHRSLATLISENDPGGAMPPMILVPGRVFGALNFRKYLTCNIAEAQTVPYAARYDNDGLISIYAKKNSVMFSSPDIAVLEDIKEKMPSCFSKLFYKDENYQKVTMSNVGFILHCAPLIFSAGLINSSHDFLFYKDLVSDDVGFYMEKIDAERLMISRKLGLSVKSAAEWLDEQYGAKDPSGIYNALQTTDAYSKILAPKSLNHRYLNEDLVYGLVPIEHLANDLGLEIPYITSLINSACLLLNCDLRLKYEGVTPNWRPIE